jgi:hypothetical protein
MFGQGDRIILLKHILEFLVLERNFMWTWFNIWRRKSINSRMHLLLWNFMKAFAPTNKGFGHLDLLVPPRFPHLACF